MVFHGAKICSDFLARMAGKDQFHDLIFSVGQSSKALLGSFVYSE
jgi:hypothetical protein